MYTMIMRLFLIVSARMFHSTIIQGRNRERARKKERQRERERERGERERKKERQRERETEIGKQGKIDLHVYSDSASVSYCERKAYYVLRYNHLKENNAGSQTVKIPLAFYATCNDAAFHLSSKIPEK